MSVRVGLVARALLAAVLLAGTASGGYWAALRQGGSDQPASSPSSGDGEDRRLAALDGLLAEQTAKTRALQAQLARAAGETEVEQSARKELETQLYALQGELGRSRDDLAFYEQLLPAGPAGTIAVRGAELTPRGRTLRYQVLVMRSTGPGAAPFTGRLQFVAEGRLSGKRQTVVLQPAQGPADLPAPALQPTHSPAPVAELTLKLDRYQRSQGVLALPEHFVLEKVTINVLQGNTVRASRSLALKF
jgi:hypothetical protein